MATSFRKPPARGRISGRDGVVWRRATVLLALSTLLFAGLYLHERGQRLSVAGTDVGRPARQGPGIAYDLYFIDTMIPHNRQSIEEAQQALQEAEHPELKSLARDIIRQQRDQIEQMRKWRTQWFANEPK